MEQNEKIKYSKSQNKVWTGLFLILIGILLLANKMHAGIPDWIFTWPMLAIAIGIFIGIQHRFRHFIWIIPVIWGGFALVDQQRPELYLHNYTTPLVLILLGLFFILRRSRYPSYAQRKEWRDQWNTRHNYEARNINDAADTTDGEWLDSTSIFGGAK